MFKRLADRRAYECARQKPSGSVREPSNERSEAPCDTGTTDGRRVQEGQRSPQVVGFLRPGASRGQRRGPWCLARWGRQCHQHHKRAIPSSKNSSTMPAASASRNDPRSRFTSIKVASISRRLRAGDDIYRQDLVKSQSRGLRYFKNKRLF